MQVSEKSLAWNSVDGMLSFVKEKERNKIYIIARRNG